MLLGRTNPDTSSAQQETNLWRELGSLSSKIPMPDLSGIIVGSRFIAWKEKNWRVISPSLVSPFQDASSVLGGFKDV